MIGARNMSGLYIEIVTCKRWYPCVSALLTLQDGNEKEHTFLHVPSYTQGPFNKKFLIVQVKVWD